MRFLTLVITSLLLAVGIGSYAKHDAGQMIVTISGWTIQTSFSFFIISIIVLFLLLHFLLRLLSYLWNMPRQFGKYKQDKHKRLSEKYLSRGLMALVEGDWNKAEISLTKGALYSQSPLVNYLAAARAAQQLGAVDRRDDYLIQAHKDSPDAEVTIGLVQAELQIKQQQSEQALATLTHLHDQKLKQDQVKKMLLHTYVKLKDWKAILELLPKIKRGGILSSEQIHVKKLEAYGGLLKQIGEEEDKKKLNNIWFNIPRKLRTEFYLIEVYTKEKLKLSDTADCEPLIRKALKKHWDVALLNLYGLVEGKDIAKQLKFSEKFLSNHAREPILLLSLGRLSIKNKLWGKAKTYLEESIDIKPIPEAYRILAYALDKLGDDRATVQYQKGLELATESLSVTDVKLLASSVK